MNRLSTLRICLAPMIAASMFFNGWTTDAQDVSAVGRTTIAGSIVRVKPGELAIKQENGDVESYKIQDKDQRAVSIGGKPIRIPAKISVTGSMPVKLVQQGMIVQFAGRCDVYGKPDGEIKTLKILPANSAEKLNVEFLERPEGRDPGDVEVIGRVVSLSGSKLQLQVPKAQWAKKERIKFIVSDDCVLEISDDDLKRVLPNDLATHVEVLELSTGDKAITEIAISLAADREEIKTSYHDKLEQEFSLLSDEPGDPRELRSDHFVLYTDVSDRNAKILLAKLETMYGLVAGYYGARPNAIIECYVVRDLRKWPSGKLPPQGAAKIAEPAGVTLTVSSANITKAVVYSCDQHSVVQHEAVHAFCAQTFGSTGPVWYSEGMAEIGQYWIPGELAVNIDPVVIDYLTTSKQKKMADIVAAGQITGDSWQAYAWRWALCHMLANNANYSKRFKKLGLNIMAKKPDSFDAAFGKVADQISFEYDLFVKNFGNGYRADLCAWDWKTKCSNLSSDGRVKQVVEAQRGWQATKLLTREGVSYDFVAQGKWKIGEGEDEISADGRKNGSGKLIGMIFHEDYKQSEPFELGEEGTFVGTSEGQLYVRCREEWTGLADNDGEVTLHIRRTPKEDGD